MAGMKRFVTYIYAYEEEKKGSNVGFARIEIRGQDARIEIHLRGVYAASAACRVYLFQREASGGKEATSVTESEHLLMALQRWRDCFLSSEKSGF